MIYSDSYSNRFGSEHLIGTNLGAYRGIISCQVKKASGLIVRELTFPNLIVDAALNRMGSGSTPTSQSLYCRLGSGTVEPNVSQTGLVNPTGGTSSVGSSGVWGNSGSAPWYNFYRRVYTFNPGVSPGNHTEIGFFSSAGVNTNIFSRALIKDELGNPTTLTLLPDEYLYVTYEIRSYVGDLTDQQTTITLGATTYNVNVRKVGVSNANGIWDPSQSPYVDLLWKISNNATQPSNTAMDIPGGTTWSASNSLTAYVQNSLQRSLVSSAGPSQANISGGIRQFYFTTSSGYSGFSLSFDAPIPKDSEKSMSITFTSEWSRYVP